MPITLLASSTSAACPSTRIWKAGTSRLSSAAKAAPCARLGTPACFEIVEGPLQFEAGERCRSRAGSPALGGRRYRRPVADELLKLPVRAAIYLLPDGIVQFGA